MNDRELMEQVEVVGYLYAVCDDLLLDHQKPNLPNEPLMTVAQHKRILAAQPQSDQDYIHLCDYCGALTDDPWHGSGEMHGKENRHIHACDNCRDRLPKYAAPAQPGSAKGKV